MISNYTIKEPTVEGVFYDGTNLDEIERWLFFKNAFLILSEKLVDEKGIPTGDLILRTTKKANGYFIHYILRVGDLVVLDKDNICLNEKSQVFVVSEDGADARFEFQDYSDSNQSPSPVPPTSHEVKDMVKRNGYERLLQTNRSPLVSTMGVRSFNL